MKFAKMLVLAVFLLLLSSFTKGWAGSVNIPEQLKDVSQKGSVKSWSDSNDINGTEDFPYYLYDGDLNTKWCSKKGDPHWVKIDLGKEYLVEKFVVYMAGNGTHGGDLGKWNYNLVDFQIQSSSTGEDKSWVDEVVVKGNLPDKEHGIVPREIKSKMMRYVRLYITNSGDGYARVPEFQIWGSLTAAVKRLPFGKDASKLTTTWASIKAQ